MYKFLVSAAVRVTVCVYCLYNSIYIRISITTYIDGKKKKKRKKERLPRRKRHVEITRKRKIVLLKKKTF